MTTMPPETARLDPKALRSVVIFVAVTIVAGWVGKWLNDVTGAADPMQGLGTLVWLLAPAFTGGVLLVTGGASLMLAAGGMVHRLGLGGGTAGSARWYLVAVPATPVALAVVVSLGLMVGALAPGRAPPQGIALLALGILGASAIRNVVEELAWRGFLTARLAEAGVPALANHIVTGLVWAAWHVPYWLFFVSAADIAAFTGHGIGPFVALGFIVLPLQAILYGELRLATGSVWPAWVLHTVSNLFSLTLLTGGLVVVSGPMAAVLSPGTGGVLYSLLLAAAGLWVWRLRRRGEEPDARA